MCFVLLFSRASARTFADASSGTHTTAAAAAALLLCQYPITHLTYHNYQHQQPTLDHATIAVALAASPTVLRLADTGYRHHTDPHAHEPSPHKSTSRQQSHTRQPLHRLLVLDLPIYFLTRALTVCTFRPPPLISCPRFYPRAVIANLLLTIPTTALSPLDGRLSVSISYPSAVLVGSSSPAVSRTSSQRSVAV